MRDISSELPGDNSLAKNCLNYLPAYIHLHENISIIKLLCARTRARFRERVLAREFWCQISRQNFRAKTLARDLFPLLNCFARELARDFAREITLASERESSGARYPVRTSGRFREKLSRESSGARYPVRTSGR